MSGDLTKPELIKLLQNRGYRGMSKTEIRNMVEGFARGKTFKLQRTRPSKDKRAKGGAITKKKK